MCLLLKHLTASLDVRVNYLFIIKMYIVRSISLMIKKAFILHDKYLLFDMVSFLVNVINSRVDLPE